MNQTIISKADLAKQAGVSRAALTKLTKPGGRLSDAVFGANVDASHPLVQEWLASHASKKGTETPEKLEEKQATAPKPTRINGVDIDNLDGLTVREVGMRYGGIDGLKRYVDSLKAISDYKYRELKIQEARGQLIEREKVRGVVFPLIDTAFARLVTDMPAALSREIVALVQSAIGDPAPDVERLLQDSVSKILKATKDAVIKSDAA